MHHLVDPRIGNLGLDGNALDQNGSPRDDLVEAFRQLSSDGILNVVMAGGAQDEALHPNTPERVQATILLKVYNLQPGLLQRACALLCSAAALTALLLSTPANADCEVGNRIFATTLSVDDPCVDDELSLSTVRLETGGNPSAAEWQLPGEYFKSITENFGVSVDDAWIRRQVSGMDAHDGFDNLVTSFLYQFIRDAHDELAMSAALDVSWGGTGSRAVGAEPFTTLTPTWLVAKGFVFLPEFMKLLRPVGVTAQLGYSFATESSAVLDNGSGPLITTRNPQFLVWGGSVQYSMPYLKSYVEDFGLPGLVNHLVPIVEVSLDTQTSNFDGGEVTTGTISPGVFYQTDKYQFGVEAVIPINLSSGHGVGVITNVHFYLENIFPNSLGKPLFGGASME